MPDDDLEPLITECPNCLTRFRVSETQLERARGRVRCGACLAVFHGSEHLVLGLLPGEETDEAQAHQALDDLLDELAGDATGRGKAPRTAPDQPARGEAPGIPAQRRPRQRAPIFGGFEEPSEPSPAGPAEPPVKQAAPPPPKLTTPPDADQVSAAPAAKTPSKPPSKPQPGSRPSAAPPAASATPAPAARADTGPAKRKPSTPPEPAPVTFGEPRQPRPLVWAGIALAVVALLAQVLWYQFDDWANEPGWRGVYAPLCRILGCELPVQEDLSQLATRNLVVRTHPQEPRALLVNAVIVNRAEFPQPYPVLELQFTSVRGNLVASRRYEPDQYLAGDAQGMALMPPRTPVQIELTMDDPGPDAVNYRLNFR